MSEAVAGTAADRDRVLDLIRAAALVMVALGHSLAGIVGWTDSGPVVSTALATYPWAAWATWLVQIMPLFFVAGGAVNARTWRSARATAGAYAPWLWRRVARLLRPVWVYLLVMAPLSGLVSALAPEGFVGPLLLLATQLLWFVGAYVVVCALTPVAVRMHDTSPLLGPATWLACAGLVDLMRLGLGLPAAVGLLNFAFTWAFVAQLGLVLDDGLLRGGRGLATAAAGIAVNLALVTVGPYPRSMVGLPGEPFSNMAPPSLALAVHAVVLTALVGATRPALARLASRARVWRATVAVNLTAMTLYLWHLPVLIALFAATHLLGLDRPVVWSADGQPLPGPGFWPLTVPFLAAFAACVVLAVRLLWPFEHRHLPWWDTPGPGRPVHHPGPLAAVGCAAIGVGTLALSATGLAGFPTRIVWFAGVPLNAVGAIGLMLLGGFLARRAGTPHMVNADLNRNRSLP